MWLAHVQRIMCTFMSLIIFLSMLMRNHEMGIKHWPRNRAVPIRRKKKELRYWHRLHFCLVNISTFRTQWFTSFILIYFLNCSCRREGSLRRQVSEWHTVPSCVKLLYWCEHLKQFSYALVNWCPTTSTTMDPNRHSHHNSSSSPSSVAAIRLFSHSAGPESKTKFL